ncbi:MAG: NfeD family protein [Clostridia bacterium]|nr:NfeD family protein [Clostridia bacterium]
MFALLGAYAVPTIALMIAAFVLLLVELFIPGFGLPGVLGLIALGAAVVLQFMTGSATVALWILAIGLAVLVAGVIALVRSLDKGRLSKSFLVLNDSIGASAGEAAKNADLVGSAGTTETMLHPAGIAAIGGERMDVVSNGEFIPAGEPVVVTAVEGTRILVKRKEG